MCIAKLQMLGRSIITSRGMKRELSDQGEGMKNLRRRKDFFPAYFFSLLIWIMASLPGEALNSTGRLEENLLTGIFLSDSFVHFFVFGLLALFIYKGYNVACRESIPLARIGAFDIGYGMIIEIYQGILPGRGFALHDMFWDTMGVLFVLGPVAGFIIRKRKARLELIR